MSVLLTTVHRIPTFDEVTQIPSSWIPSAPIPSAYDESFRRQVSEPGTGQATFPADAPVLDDLRVNDVLRFTIDGNLAASSVIERLEDHTLDEQGGAEEWTKASGRSIDAVNEWGVIVPGNGLDAQPVEEDRLLSWQVAQYVEGADGQDWDDAVEVGDATGRVRRPGTQLGFPAGTYSAAGAKWLWGTHPTETVDDTFAPGGRVYGRATLTLAATRTLLIGYAFDNWGQIWFDGQLIGTLEPSGGPENYLRLHKHNLEATAGDHQIAFTAFNKGPATDPGPPDNPGGAYVIIGTIDTDGSLNTILLTTNATDWNVLGYPDDPPGMTPGQAVLIILEEIQARDGLTWLVPDFDETNDSNGTAWPVVADITTKTGTDLLTFLGELSDTYVDWEIHPDGVTFSMYVKGDQAQVGGAAVPLVVSEITDPASGNLLQHDRVRT